MTKDVVEADLMFENHSTQFTHECDIEDKLLPRNPLEEGLPTQDEAELVNKLQSLVAGCPSKEELTNATKYSPLDWECEISGIAC
eukprot:8996023-Ditylum_brightwellii.AAC.1